MELQKIRGGTKNDLYNGKYNIYVGISLGNKWFTPEKIFGLIEWSLKHTKEYVGVVPADEIHAINLEVRNRVSRARALQLVKKERKEIIEDTKEIVDNNLDQKAKSKVIFGNWSDVEGQVYNEKVEYLYSEFEQNDDFRETILSFVRDFVSNEDRSFSKEDIEKLGTYLIEELPELTCRVPIDGIEYDAWVYPHDSNIMKFVEKLQNAEAFPQISDTLVDTRPKVFLAVR